MQASSLQTPLVACRLPFDSTVPKSRGWMGKGWSGEHSEENRKAAPSFPEDGLRKRALDKNLHMNTIVAGCFSSPNRVRTPPAIG